MIHIYHHIWPGGVGLEIAEKQKNRLFNSIADNFTYHPNIVSINQNECHTLLKMLNEIKEFDSEDYVLFLHTKGASKSNEAYEKEWREYMELSLIDNYKEHVRLLDDGFDTSGVLNNFNGLGPDFIKYWGCGSYGGNFWWAKVDCFNRMSKNIKNMWGRLEDRHMSEWCFLSKIYKWNPAVINPSFDNFNTFYEYIVKENQIAKDFRIDKTKKKLL
jgi:hypothetical protein